MDFFSISGIIALAAITLQAFRGPPRQHVHGACSRLEQHLKQNLVGQEPAVREILVAVCAHLAEREPQQPLVMSVHGPPGVGKSLFHTLLAESLYNFTDGHHECPGRHCPAYKIVFGTDYTAGEAETQHILLREALTEHFKMFTTALVVVEEFDKASCASRELLRHLVEHGSSQLPDSNIHRSIILLESNTGYLDLHRMLLQANNDRSKVPMATATQVLKDKVFSEGMEQACMEHVDSNRFVNSISSYLPFFPLEREHMRKVAALQLTRREKHLRAEGRLGALEWDDSVLETIASKVYYEDGFAVEGASQLRMIISRLVFTALRTWDTEIFERIPSAGRRQLRLRLSAEAQGPRNIEDGSTLGLVATEVAGESQKRVSASAAAVASARRA